MKRFLFRTVLPVGLISLACLIWSASLIPAVPDPLAVHFSGSSPNGFADPLVFWLLTSGLVVGLVALYCWLLAQGAARGPMARFHAASMAFGCFLVSGAQLSTFLTQKGLSDATQATLSWGHLAAIFGSALGGSALITLLATPLPAAESTVIHPEALDVPAGGAASWNATLTIPLPFATVLGLSTAVLLSLGIFTNPWLLLAAGFLLLLSLSMGYWRLRADSRGLSCRSMLGWPRRNIPAAEIERAEVTEIQPMNWGGWGWRTNPRGQALVLGKGPGLRMVLRSSKIMEITCEDAPTAAAVLNHYAGAATRTPR
ncbi:hypothetical protein [Corynebacterium lowii]|uniref:DUF1648 domain-containing protein n=1 Tax=Corynebacterium lowii TaxID=1544413 RepID=A0A0Q0UK62_9CORY|nr:hypothetical protein [Corynebacterium lowii]KQB86651.1 hypothetical protein Clow_00859 [Corynebacterium lowii]MDP9851336.1 hypothetical protein [Corynebacterium lowii]